MTFGRPCAVSGELRTALDGAAEIALTTIAGTESFAAGAGSISGAGAIEPSDTRRAPMQHFRPGTK